MAGWNVEVVADLKKSAQVKLDANGLAVVQFSPDHANQRWQVTYIGVTTNQNANATLIPYAVPALNTVSLTTMSAGNQRAQATWSGNNDAFRGLTDVGPCDFLSVLFYPPPGQSGAALSGVIASVVITGTKYTKRG